MNARKSRYIWLVVCVLLAAGLRLYRLDSQPLRGDEAFTVRYWAAPFNDVMALAATEPHPLGTFFLFGFWKTVAGESEFAMRALPALLNLIGVAVMLALGRTLFAGRRIGWLPALLYAVNPFLIWHSQDVRNYAIWAALSPLALYALLYAARSRTRRGWLIYVVCAALALYSFYFELFFVIVGGLWIVIWRRGALRSYLLSMVAVGVLLIPWLWQAYRLATSGYRGTAGGVVLSDLVTQFLPGFILGDAEVVSGMYWLWPLLALIGVGAAIGARIENRATAPTIKSRFLILYFTLPVLLLTMISTRMNVFLPRYVIAVIPALLLLITACFGLIGRLGRRPLVGFLMVYGVVAVVLPLREYYWGGHQKAPDWRALRDYLYTHVKYDDILLFPALDTENSSFDPAFRYYVKSYKAWSVPYDISEERLISSFVSKSHSIWFIPIGLHAGGIDQALRNNLQLISDRGAGKDFIVREYRPLTIYPGEIRNNPPYKASVDGSKLIGYNIDQAADQLTVILYWDRAPSQTVSVRLVKRDNNNELLSQHDHPAMGMRDIYTLSLKDVPPGEYQLHIVLYEPTNPAQPLMWALHDAGLPASGAFLTNVNVPLSPTR